MPAYWGIGATDPFRHQLQAEGRELDGLIQGLHLGNDAELSRDFIQLPEESQVDAELTTAELVDLVVVRSLYLQQQALANPDAASMLLVTGMLAEVGVRGDNDD
jgi:hypothetical protein